MLSGAEALHEPVASKHQSLAWFSRDGRNWSAPVEIGDPNQWLWRITWHEGRAYSVGYDTVGAESSIRLYTSKDGRQVRHAGFDGCSMIGDPNETSIVFLSDDTALCLLRRDGDQRHRAYSASRRPPYTKWEWKDLGMKIGGPHMIRLPDGRLVAAVRLYDGDVRTSLGWIDPAAGKFTEFLKLPSGGDTSYAGLVLHDGLLWVSYYSSHEGKTSIYLAKVRL